MPFKPPRRCTSCRHLHHGPKPKCTKCLIDQRRQIDARRGSARARGYDKDHEELFRAAVLGKHPVCVLCGQRPSVVADHWPLTRRELVARGLDPNDAAHGRGLCDVCDKPQTAARSPGGWADPSRPRD